MTQRSTHNQFNLPTEVAELQQKLRHGQIYTRQVELAAFLGHAPAIELVGAQPDNTLGKCSNLVLDICDWGPEVQRYLIRVLAEMAELELIRIKTQVAPEFEQLNDSLIDVIELMRELRFAGQLSGERAWQFIAEVQALTHGQFNDWIRLQPEREKSVNTRDFASLLRSVQLILEARLCDEGPEVTRGAQYLKPVHQIQALTKAADRIAKILKFDVAQFRSTIFEKLKAWLLDELQPTMQTSDWLHDLRVRLNHNAEETEQITIFQERPHWKFFVPEPYRNTQDWPKSEINFVGEWIRVSGSKTVVHIGVLWDELLGSIAPLLIQSPFNHSNSHTCTIGLNQNQLPVTPEKLLALLRVIDHLLEKPAFAKRGFKFSGAIPTSADHADPQNGGVYLDNLELIELLKRHGLDSLLRSL